MDLPGWVKIAFKSWMVAVVIGHSLEAPFAYAAARKRGEDPWKSVFDTLALGAIAFIPLLRKPKLEEGAAAVDI